MKHRILFAIALVFSACLQAQSFDQAKLDSLFSRLATNDQAMGSLSLMKNGEVIYQKAIGYAEVETNLLATPKTRYRIGSISKTFTSVLVMQAVETGDISLDTKLAAYFPDLPNAAEITIEHLLRHRSGLANLTNDPDFLSYMEKPITRAELLAKFRAGGTDFPPGERFAYSNTNYMLLGFIMEDLNGQVYEDILQEHIIDPLGLDATYYGGVIDPGQMEARSYEAASPWRAATETNMSIPGGAGAIVSIPKDLNEFFRAIFEGRLLADSTTNQMTTLTDGYGLGLFALPFGARTAYGHNGKIDGFQTTAAYFPEEDLAIAYLSNGVNYPINDIMLGVLSIYFGVAYELPDFAAIPRLTEEELDAYLGVYKSPAFPLDVTITRDGTRLMGQATGQPPFPLQPEGDHVFTFKQAGLELAFAPEANEMILRQGGMEWTLTRD